jgi:hypothetical protein
VYLYICRKLNKTMKESNINTANAVLAGRGRKDIV